MDTKLYQLVQGTAHSRGCSISQLIEEAVRDYILRHSASSADRVGESFGQYRVSPAELREILEDEPFEA